MQSVKCVIAGQNPGGASISVGGPPSDVRGWKAFVAVLVGFVRVWRTGWRRFELVDGSMVVVFEKDLMVSCARA